jgi:tetratricopeptide (TPR) repeat protein
VINGFLTELRRRRVLTVAGAYIAIAWLATEIAGFLLEQSGAPGWILRVLAIALVVGFPVAVIIAWVLQRQPDGRVAFDSSHGRRKAVVGAVVAGLVLTAGLSWLIVPRIEDPPEYPDYDPLPNSVAIMPFLDPSATPNEVTIGETLYIALSTGLKGSGRLTQVKLRLKEQPEDLAALGRQVRALTLLSSRLLRTAGTIRVEMSLLDVASGSPLWTRQFDWDSTRIMDLGTDIANGVLQSLDLPVISSDRFAGTNNREAYDAYLLGRYYSWERFRTDELRLAFSHFQRAVDLDPGYVEAYVALAGSIRFYLQAQGPPDQEREILEQRLQRALESARELDPDSPAVIRLSAILSGDDGVICRALEHLMVLQPSESVDLRYIGQCVDDIDEREHLQRRNLELDPLNSNLHQELALTLRESGRFNEALAEMDAAIELDPEYALNLEIVALWSMEDSRLDIAIPYQREACALNQIHGACAANTSLWYAQLGAEQEALAWANKARELSPGNERVWFHYALTLIYLERLDLAFEYVDQALERFPEDATWQEIQSQRDIHFGKSEPSLHRFEGSHPQLEVQNFPDVYEWESFGKVLQYARLLMATGRQRSAEHLLTGGLARLDEFCSTITTDPARFSSKYWCNLQTFRTHALLQNKEEALSLLQLMIAEQRRLHFPWRSFMGLGSLKDEPEFQHLMEILAEERSVQLERVREKEQNGDLPPLPWEVAQN